MCGVVDAGDNPQACEACGDSEVLFLKNGECKKCVEGDASYDLFHDFDPVEDENGGVIDIDPRVNEDYTWDDLSRINNEKRLWTQLDCDGTPFMAPGYHYVNRMAYHETKKPYVWEPDHMPV